MVVVNGGNETKKKSEKKIANHYIAYFDILGYKAFFEDKENDIEKFLKDTLSLAQDMKIETKRASESTFELSYKMFSDNCIIVTDQTNKEALKYLVHFIAVLQIRFLAEYSIPIRGAISLGEVYLDDNIVFGKGLIDVVNLESKEAKYPRIILSQTTINEEIIKEINDSEGIIKQDHDKLYYVDYFTLMRVRDLYSSSPERVLANKVRKSVYNLVTRNGHYDKRLSDEKKIEETSRTILKYLWMLEHYNTAVKKYNLPITIEYSITVSDRFFRFEISNLKQNSWPVVVS